jgi:ribosomal protein S18 acetylase RimI-like enzyme
MPEDYAIELTTSETDFADCSAMMAAQDPWVKLGFSEAVCLLAFPGDHRQVWVLRKAEKIRGFIIVQHKGSFRGYIQTLCVHPDFHNTGSGSALLAFAEKQIATYSPNVFICVSSFNEKAHALYLRKGYSEVGILKDFIKTGFDEILMRKTSGPNLHYKPPQSSL